MGTFEGSFLNYVIAILQWLTPSNAPILVTAILALGVGAVICANTRGAQVGVLFFQATIFLSIYLVGRYMTLEADSPGVAYSWALITSIGVLGAPIALYQYVAHMVGVAKERHLFIAVNWLFAIVLIVANLMSGFLYTHVEHFPFGYVPQYSEWGQLNSTWTIMVMAVVVLDFLQQYWRAAQGSLRKHRILAFFMAQLWIFFLYIDSVASHNIPMPQLGWLSVLMYVAMVARASKRYRLVDITPAFAAQKVMDTAGEAILVLDAEGEVRVANLAAGILFGRSQDVLVGTHASLLTPKLRISELNKATNEKAVTEFELDRGHQSKVMAMHVGRLDGDGIEGGYVCSLRDVTHQKQVERQLRYESLHDSLTGLPNRVAFQAQLEFQLNEQEKEEHIAVLFIDLNGFKKINDQHGHRVGDIVLATVARRLERACAEDALVSRLAGDEFAVLLPSGANAEGMAQRIADSLAEAIEADEKQVNISASIGISYAGGEGDTALALIKDADYAMYRAKSQGGGFSVFDRSMRGKPARRAVIESEIREAMQAGDMATWYQSVVDVSGRCKARRMEALLRWNHPEKGVIEAKEFIEVAENSPMILEMGQHALGNVCQFLRHCKLESPDAPVRVSCNLSEVELAQNDLPERLIQTLKYYGLDADCLEVEITERVAVEADPDMLQRLADVGVGVVIDDFGMGGSSLSRLASLPVSAIKLSYSFSREIVDSTPHRAVVKAVLALAKDLEIDVIAQGVETQAQSDAFQSMGCYLQQGLLFGEAVKPLDVVLAEVAEPAA